MIHVRAWRSGRSFGKWHLWFGQMRLPLCGAEPPKLAAFCELSSSPALQLESLCRRCLLAFSLHEEGAVLTPTPESR